ncbi:MAG: glycosyltransferase [Cyanobacteria bacterium M_surface_7_m2_040]|nr:glycosyltransferase [Cyanobacteria bacterium K_DeepCast_35m_m1_288]MBM5808253.1 glycosyltransferase [Cyanobacteria bacterium M_surface_9_m1_291]MBM5827018.1 glycosyltransferase [Cyanobacteria bacterium M_surface_7_m2_040]
MRLLLIHQNFPGQFRQLAPYLLQRGHELVAICSHPRPIDLPCRILRYAEPAKPPQGLSFSAQIAHEALARADRVARLCHQLAQEGWRPDRICVHSGWGESLGLREVWPEVPQVLWPELWVLPEHGGYGVDPLKPPAGLDSQLEQLGRNSLTRAALAMASAWVLPTWHQANSLPAEFQGPRLHVIHEGIDTQVACPNPQVSYVVRGITINRETPTLTFVNRNLERLRGFDTFMRALPVIQRQHPQVRVVVVGDSGMGYGGAHPGDQPLRQQMLQELEGQLDLERIHFLGRIPHPSLMALLQASWVHVYLSYPFVLGWSLLEAMACGCCIVGSRGMPVEEVIRDGVEGLLVPMDDSAALAAQVLVLLADSERRHRLGAAARTMALSWDQRVVLPELAAVIEQVNPISPV